MSKKYYPVNKPINTYYIDVGNNNKLFVKEYGNKNGIPIIYLHGGPGGALYTNKVTKYFNLLYYHLFIIDQRGCGKSTPRLTINNHNTNELINDIEKVRKYFSIKKFIITGGSWGATLSLLYSINYPENIITYILRNGCYFTENSIWPKCIFEMYPDKWEEFCKLINIPLNEIKNPTFSIQKKICLKYFNKIRQKKQKYINAWFNFENDLIYTIKKKIKKNKTKKQIKLYNLSKEELAFYESYYYYKNFFLPVHYVENNCNKIKDIKGYIFHGRLDIICNFNESYKIHKKLPKSKLIISDFEGHSGTKTKQLYIDLLKKLSKKYFKYRNNYYN